MPTHDYIIANGTGAAVRADINLALSAIVSLNSSASEPGTMYAYQLWADTAAGLLKIRNGANSAWVTLRQLDGDFSIVAVEDGLQATPSLTFTNDLNTGVFRSGADALAIVTGGQYAITCTSTQAVGIRTPNPSTALHVAGNARVGADDVTDAHLQIGKGASGNRNSYIDIVADTTYTDYGLRVIRNNTGANATSELKHRGTGALNITTQEAAPIEFYTTNSPRLTILAGGNVGIGTSTPGAVLESKTANVQAGDAAYAKKAVITNIPYSTSNVTSSALAIYDGTVHAADIGYSYDGTGYYLTFGTNDNTVGAPIESLRIDRSGRVGIGTTGPARQLDVNKTAIFDSNGDGTTTSPSIAIGSSGTGLSYIGSQQLAFLTNSTERARIDGSGRLLVGTSSAAGSVDAQYALIHAYGNTSGNFQGGRINIGRAEFSANITADEILGDIYFSDAQSGTYGRIECVADGTAGSGDYPGRLVFSTTPDGSASPTERMRIDKDGTVKIGASGRPGTLIVTGDVNNNEIVLFDNLRTVGGYAEIDFRTAGTERGNIRW